MTDIQLNKNIVEECRTKLIIAKEDILNRVRTQREGLYETGDNRGGDEGDQTVRALAESEALRMNERLRTRLVEIEMALGRIEKSTFGICEETEEIIEAERLLAIPWTRLSIEGAEIRDSMKTRYAR